MTIEVFAADWSELCDLLNICRDDDGAWQVLGRAGAKNEAKVLESQGRRVLRGVSETGWYGEDGQSGYQGTSQVPVAVVGTERQVFAVVVGDHEIEDDVFDRIVASLVLR